MYHLDRNAIGKEAHGNTRDAERIPHARVDSSHHCQPSLRVNVEEMHHAHAGEEEKLIFEDALERVQHPVLSVRRYAPVLTIPLE